MSNTTVLQAAQSLAEIKTNGGDPDVARGNLRSPILRACKAASTTNIASLSGAATVDGISLVAGDAALLTGQTAASQNGPWVVQTGAWTRPGDYTAALGSLTHARIVVVASGSTANKGVWQLATIPATVDTTATTWTAPVTAGGGGGVNYQTIQVGGSAQTQRAVLDLIAGSGMTITAVDNSGSGRTEITFVSSGSFSRTSTDSLYTPQWPNIVSPPGASFPAVFGTGTPLAVFTPRGVRVIVPKAGTLHDIAWWVTAQSGNMAAAIYDTGDASAGNRTLLYSTGSIAVGAIGWQTVDPALTVTAGQQLDFFIMADNTTAAFAKYSVGLANTAQLPTGFAPAAGGASPKLMFQSPSVANLTAWTTPLAEANVTTTNTTTPILFARVA